MASSVIAGCNKMSRLFRFRLMAMNPAASMSAQPKCNDGMAANWLETEREVSRG